MSQQQPPQPQRPSRQLSNPNNGVFTLPPEIMDILVPGFKVGVAASGVGAFVGAVTGIMLSTSPGYASINAGIHWATCASTYTVSRRMLIRSWGGDENLTKSDKVKISTVAGGCAGLMPPLIWGGRGFIGSAVMYAVLGAGGQFAYNAFAKDDSRVENKKSWLDSKWSPLTPLTDEHYVSILEEKILRIDAEIAIIDENIAALRVEDQKQKEAAKQAAIQPNTTEASKTKA